MKKQYINPMMDVVEIKLQNSLMVLSSAGFGADVDSAAGAEGRGGDVDDWED